MFLSGVAMLLFDAPGHAFLHLTNLPAKHLHHFPALLQSYIKSSPFTLMIHAPFHLIWLAMFHLSKSKIL